MEMYFPMNTVDTLDVVKSSTIIHRKFSSLFTFNDPICDNEFSQIPNRVVLGLRIWRFCQF